MLRMRLRRVGAKNRPSYRIVVADSRAARDGAFVDYLGHYNPRTEPPTVVIDEEKARKWLSVGAKPSDAVQRIIDKMGDNMSDETGAPQEEAADGEAAVDAQASTEPSAAEDAEPANDMETTGAV